MLRIRIYQAGSVYEVACGARDRYDTRGAMLTDSLFLDYMLENGLKVHSSRRGDSTRDIICLNFDYGASSYEEARAKASPAGLSRVEERRALFDKKSKEELRELFYENGVDIKYEQDKPVHYKMLYRTPGKAKKGQVMFVRSALYKKARDYLYMGMKLPRRNAPIVEMGAYSSLTTSTICGKVKIEPDEVLILNDVDVEFMTNVVSIEIDEAHRCQAVPRDGYVVKNTLFDGQALIDESIFPEWGDGYILLRHQFTKCAAFCTRLQKFFADYYGDAYHEAYITDMFGRRVKVDGVKLLTTNNAVKWVKLGATFNYWADWVRANGSQWGIVKTAHPSKLGEVQRMSYQMVNSLAIDIMPAVMQNSVDYVVAMKLDDAKFLDYLRLNINFSNDFDVLIDLCENDPDFVRSDYFRARKREIISAYVKNMKNGRVNQNADNLTIVGSPYAMLLYAVGEDPRGDPTFAAEEGAIQCWTGRFEAGDYLAAFRSPFNSQNNMDHLHNVTHPLLEKYFNFGRLIIAVNMNGTDFQDKNNGSDQDSDSVYCTNQPDIVAHAKYCVANYPTIVNNISKEKNHYSSAMKDFAEVDNNLAHSQRSIGESSNLAQICLSYGHTFEDQKYKDFACILAVLAQAAIDSSKRRFDVNITNEISRIRKEMRIDEIGYPAFWLAIRRNFNKNKINWDIKCPMNELYHVKIKSYQPTTSTLPNEEFIYNYEKELGNMEKIPKKVEELISDFSLSLMHFTVSSKGDNLNPDNYDENKDEYLVVRSDFDELVRRISELTLSKKSAPIMSYLINRAFGAEGADSKLRKNKALLLKTLYKVNRDLFINIFSKHKDAKGQT